jgi:hypothetical protein
VCGCLWWDYDLLGWDYGLRGYIPFYDLNAMG